MQAVRCVTGSPVRQVVGADGSECHCFYVVCVLCLCFFLCVFVCVFFCFCDFSKFFAIFRYLLWFLYCLCIFVSVVWFVSFFCDFFLGGGRAGFLVFL